jgi:hypothetical protein
MTEGTTTAAGTARIPMAIARWKSGKLHVTRDGIKTGCGALIPTTATVTRATLDWHLHTNCYNCAYRLWPTQGPAEYLCPSNGSDFPPRRRDQPRPPQRPQNWPCPRGCTNPADHAALLRYPKCTVLPDRREAGPDGRCTDGCESTEKAMSRANPGMYFDLADSASMICYHCNGMVCIGCQKVPVTGLLMFCEPCGQSADSYTY